MVPPGKMAGKGSSLGGSIEAMVKVIEDTRRLATKVPVDTSSFIAMAFYLGELKDVLSHLNSKQHQRVDLASKNPEAHNGLQRLKGTLDKLQKMTLKASAQSSRLFLTVDTVKLMSDLQAAVQDVGHDLNLVPVLSLMASSLPSDAQDKVADLRSRMRVAKFDSEPEVLQLSAQIEEAVIERSKEKATKALVGVLKHFGGSTNIGLMGNEELESLQEEVARDLRLAEKEQRWAEVGKLLDIKTFLGLASLSQEPPIVQATSRLAKRLQDSDPALAIPSEFKCSLSGEVLKDPVLLVETQQTFDRSAIEAWFAQGKRTCPKTSHFLRSAELVPNLPLRKGIEEYFERLNKGTLAEAVKVLQLYQDASQQRPTASAASAAAPGQTADTPSASSAAAGGERHGATGQEAPAKEGAPGADAAETVANAEASSSATGVSVAAATPPAGPASSSDVGSSSAVETVGASRAGASPPTLAQSRQHLEEALEALMQLTARDPAFGAQALALGVVGPLVELISPAGLEPGSAARDNALLVLKYLAATGERAVLSLLEAGAVPFLVKIVSADTSDVAAAVLVLSAVSKIAAGRKTITEEMGIVEAIKLLNKHQGAGDEVAKAVNGVLEMYWKDDPYVAIQMASVGMFHPLIQLLGPGNDMDTRLMMADGVTQWGVNKASRVTLVQGGVLPPLVDLLNNGPPSARATAARSIEHLSHTDINRVALAKAGVIPALVKALSNGTKELKSAAQATLANLAMDDQDLDSLDEDGTAIRLITMLRTGLPANRDYAIRTLECMARESKSIRAALMEDDGAVPAVFDVLKEAPSHGFTAGSLRSSALLLLSHLCFEPASKDLMVTSPQVVKTLATLLNRPIPQDEREAIAIVMATIVGNKDMRAVVRGEDHVYTLMHKKITNGPPKIKEKMLWGFAYICEHDEADPQVVLDAQQAVAQLGVVPTAVHYLKMGPDVMRIPSTILLGNLSCSSPSLSALAVNDRRHSRSVGSVSKRLSKLSGFMRSSSLMGKSKEPAASPSSASSQAASPSVAARTEKLRSCKVHSGKCSLEATFCLVEGDLVGVLLELVKRGEDQVVEVALSAVATLIADEDDQERAADFLVKMDMVEIAANLVGRSKVLTKWAVYILERIFEFKRFRAGKFAQPAITALGRYMTTATGPERKLAAETLMRLDILPKNSLEGDL